MISRIKSRESWRKSTIRSLLHLQWNWKPFVEYWALLHYHFQHPQTIPFKNYTVYGFLVRIRTRFHQVYPFVGIVCTTTSDFSNKKVENSRSQRKLFWMRMGKWEMGLIHSLQQFFYKEKSKWSCGSKEEVVGCLAILGWVSGKRPRQARA